VRILLGSTAKNQDSIFSLPIFFGIFAFMKKKTITTILLTHNFYWLWPPWFSLEF